MKVEIYTQNLNVIYEIKGKLSYHLIFFLHFGQKDRPLIICLSLGKR